MKTIGKLKRKRLDAIALRDANFSLFKPEEIALVDEVIQKYWGIQATQISNMSHNFVGWKLVGENEDIPYSVGRVHRREPSLKEIAYAKELMAERARQQYVR